jgi:transposase
VDPQVFLVEDNAPVHGKKGARSTANIARKDLDIFSIDRPPGSPDMNVIENVWRIIKQRIRKRNWRGGWVLEDLIQAVKEEWEALTFDDIEST